MLAGDNPRAGAELAAGPPEAVERDSRQQDTSPALRGGSQSMREPLWAQCCPLAQPPGGRRAQKPR